MMGELIGLIITLVLLILGYFFGSMLEKRHFASLRKREADTLGQPIVTFDETDEEFSDDPTIESVTLVSGSVVVSVDYFKRFVAGLRNIFGGNVSSYETLIDRARREALLRMKEKAKGASRIANLRMETSTLSSGKGIGSIEVHAYGTAVFTSERISAGTRASTEAVTPNFI